MHTIELDDTCHGAASSYHEIKRQRDALQGACGLAVFALGMAIGEGVLKQDTELYLQQALDECRKALREANR